MSSEIEVILNKIVQDFQEIPFNRHKKETIARVIHETPKEISWMTKNFKDNGLDKVVTTENDFLLGTVISFIYYKFLLYCTFEGDPIREQEIPLLQSCLFSNGSKLNELIFKVTGK